MFSKRTSVRSTALACGAAVAALLPFQLASAQEARASIKIAAKPLGASLTELGQKTGVNVLFSPAAVEGLQAKPISITATPEEAARLLVAGTRLEVMRDPTGALIIRRRAGGLQPISMRADGAQASPMARAGVAGGRPGVAETLPQQTAPALDEIVVTAQKRAENLQDTPISISALGEKELERRGIANINDLMTGAVPSLRINSFGGRSSNFLVNMRGISSGASDQISRDAAVGMYVDGVYLGRTHGLGAELFDIERIEVLRGPQGTLFGRNAVGGAVSIISKKPTGEFGADLTAGVRNFDGWNLAAHVNLPEFAGLSIKIDGVLNKRDGWIDNPLPGAKDWFEIDRRGLRLTALWRPTDTLEAQYSFDTSRDASSSGYNQIAQIRPGTPFPPLFTLEPRPVERGRVGAPLGPNLGRVEGHSLHVTWEITDRVSLKSISSYRELTQGQDDNSGALTTVYQPNGLFGRRSFANVRQDQFSQEFQVIGSSDRVDYVAGIFYFDEDAEDSAYAPSTLRFNSAGTDYVVLPTPAGGPPPDRASVVHAKSLALFAQATFTPPVLEDRLHLTGGVRWTHDQKDGRLTALRGVPTALAFDFESKRLDPSATIAFDWSEDVNTYLRWGVAYRAGGANSRSATFRPFAEEEVESVELGLKAELFQERARFNVAAYRTEYKDRQVDFINPANSSNLETLNAPGVEIIKGLEADLTVAPARGLQFNIAYAYITSKGVRDINPFTGLPQIGRTSYSPKHAASAAIDYSFEPFSFGVLSAHLDANYSSSFYTGGSSQPKTAPYTVLNARLTLGEVRLASGGELAISLWGKNLTDERWEIFQLWTEGRGLSNTLGVIWNEPRTYGAEARVRF